MFLLGWWNCEGGLWLRSISCKGNFEVGKGSTGVSVCRGVFAEAIEEKGKGVAVSLAVGGRGGRGQQERRAEAAGAK